MFFFLFYSSSSLSILFSYLLLRFCLVNVYNIIKKKEEEKEKQNNQANINVYNHIINYN
jgi:hypothetical protein